MRLLLLLAAAAAATTPSDGRQSGAAATTPSDVQAADDLCRTAPPDACLAAYEALPPSAHRHIRLGSTLTSTGDSLGALAHLEAAQALGHPGAEPTLRRLYRRHIKHWHFSMLNDAPRNEAYDAALRAAISSRPGMVVLDIGSGSGLLAMMAARAGAEHVYSCEVNPLIARLARRIVAANGLADRVTIINKLSSDLTVGEDLPRRVDLVVSEIYESMLLGEGVLPATRDALARLAAPGAAVVPRRATLWGALAESPRLERCASAAHGDPQHVSLHQGFRLSLPLTHLSEPVALAEFDFARPGPPGERDGAALALPTRDGRAAFVHQWWTLDDLGYSTLRTNFTHWWQPAHIVPSPVDVEAGRAVRVAFRQTSDYCFDLEVEGGGAPRQAGVAIKEQLEDHPEWDVCALNDPVLVAAFRRALPRARGRRTLVVGGDHALLAAPMAALSDDVHLAEFASTAAAARAALGPGSAVAVSECGVGPDCVPYQLEALVSLLHAPLPSVSGDAFGQAALHWRAASELRRAGALAADAVLVPARVEVRALLVESPWAHAHAHVDRAAGFDVSLFNVAAPLAGIRGFARVGVGRQYAPLSPAVTLAEWDLAAEYDPHLDFDVPIPISASGTAHAFLLWLAYDLGDGETLDVAPTRPPDNAVHSEYCLYHLPPTAVRRGLELRVEGRRALERCSL